MAKKKKPAPRLQYGALPFRLDEKGEVEVMLITSRGTGRWIIPKGWPMKAGPRHTARTEAWEESGVRGKLLRRPLGTFKYRKVVKNARSFRCVVRVYSLVVETQSKRWPESGQRRVAWFSVEQAVKKCSDPALGRLLRNLPKP